MTEPGTNSMVFEGRLMWIVAGMLVVVIAGISLYGLADYPTMHCDEAIYADISTSVYQRGAFGMSMAGDQYGIDRNHPLSGRLFHLWQGALLLTLGNTLFVTRLASMAGWLVGGVFAYRAAWILYRNKEVGVIAALAFLYSLNALFFSHSGRPDVWVPALSLVALDSYLRVREKPNRVRWLGLSVLIGGLAISVHLNAVWSFASLGLFAAVGLIRQKAWGDLVAFMVPGVVLALAVAASNFWPGPALALSFLNHVSYSLPISGGLLSRFVATGQYVLLAYGQNIGGAVIPFGVLALASVVMLLIRRTAADRTLLGVLALAVALFAIGTSYKHVYYTAIFEGLLALVIAGGLWHLSGIMAPWVEKHAPKLTRGALAFLLVMPLIGINGLAWGYLTLKYSARDYPTYNAELAALVPDGTRTLGSLRSYFVLQHDTDYVSGAIFGLNPTPQLTAADIEGTFAGLDVDYVVIDSYFQCPSVVTPQHEAYVSTVSGACEVVGEIDNRLIDINGEMPDQTVIYQCGQ